MSPYMKYLPLCREIFPGCVHILQMPVLHQVICMVCGREGPGVEFKVREGGGGVGVGLFLG